MVYLSESVLRGWLIATAFQDGGLELPREVGDELTRLGWIEQLDGEDEFTTRITVSGRAECDLYATEYGVELVFEVNE